jgi:ArsR family transcriptional regulator
MKIAFPTKDNQGVNSIVDSHFGSAQYFVVLETEGEKVKTAVNHDLGHKHGHCQPLRALGGNSVDAVVVGGIGRGALGRLIDAGIKVYRAERSTVYENLALIKSGRLTEFTLDQTCAGPGPHGKCAH